MARPGVRLGTVSRITVAGAIYVELADVAPGFEFGPVIDAVGGLAVGDRVTVQSLARDEDEFVVTGLIGGLDLEPYATTTDLAAGLADKVTTTALDVALDPYVTDDDTRLVRQSLEAMGSVGGQYAVTNDSTYRRPTHVAALTVPIASPAAVYRMGFTVDGQTGGAGGYLIGSLFIDGTAIRPQGVLYSPAGAVRAPITKTVRVTGLSAGDHAVEVRVSTGSSGTGTVYEHSNVFAELVA